jgi:hypothetical protein
MQVTKEDVEKARRATADAKATADAAARTAKAAKATADAARATADAAARTAYTAKVATNAPWEEYIKLKHEFKNDNNHSTTGE